jgi:hypothetical protein
MDRSARLCEATHFDSVLMTVCSASIRAASGGYLVR